MRPGFCALFYPCPSESIRVNKLKHRRETLIIKVFRNCVVLALLFAFVGCTSFFLSTGVGRLRRAYRRRAAILFDGMRTDLQAR